MSEKPDPVAAALGRVPTPCTKVPNATPEELGIAEPAAEKPAKAKPQADA